MNIVAIDFETYWAKDFSLRSKELNMSEYVRDERFSVHMMGIKVNDLPTQIIEPDRIEETLAGFDWTQDAVLAHNVAFDGFILSEHYNVVPAMYYDTLSMARGMFSVNFSLGLDDVARYCGFEGKMKGVLKESKDVRDLPPDLYQRMAEYCAQDVDQTHKVFWHMMQAEYPVEELELIDMTIRMFCDPVLRVDLPRVQKALEAETGKKVAALFKAGARAEDLVSNQKFSDLLASRGVLVPKKISARTGKPAPALAKNDPGFIRLGKDPRVADLIEARKALKSSIGETRAGRLLKVGDDPLPVLLNYCGAHTTRWSAGNKMNLQNLPRKGELRKSILAPEGHAIVVADSAQIEARVLAWLAGEKAMLKLFAERADPYRWMAGQVYEKSLEEVSNSERFIGKVLVLALGYGMGPDKLQETLAKGALGAAPLEVPRWQANTWVEAYRRTNVAVVRFWDEMKQVIQRMMTESPPMEYHPLVIQQEAIILPSGLALQYPDLKQTVNKDGRAEITYQSKGQRSRLYGGLLTENIVQALARCIIAEQMLKIGKRYRIVTMTHDEIVAVAPLSEAAIALQFMIDTMATSPAWAPDLPLGAEGGWDTMYSK